MWRVAGLVSRLGGGGDWVALLPHFRPYLFRVFSQIHERVGRNYRDRINPPVSNSHT